MSDSQMKIRTIEQARKEWETDESYVGYARFKHHYAEGDGTDHKTLEICDSDAEGAFKIYRHPRAQRRHEKDYFNLNAPDAVEGDF